MLDSLALGGVEVIDQALHICHPVILGGTPDTLHGVRGHAEAPVRDLGGQERTNPTTCTRTLDVVDDVKEISPVVEMSDTTKLENA